MLRKAYPELQVICGELAARELPGYGYEGAIVAKRGGDVLEDGALALAFVDYPAEVHLQNGLLCLEQNTGVFYSSDLFLRFGNGVGETIEAGWEDEVAAIGADRAPVEAARKKLKDDLSVLAPKFVAVDHGYCLDCA